MFFYSVLYLFLIYSFTSCTITCKHFRGRRDHMAVGFIVTRDLCVMATSELLFVLLREIYVEYKSSHTGRC
jgi:hypothetical protein